jgi:hypothetical protein
MKLRLRLPCYLLLALGCKPAAERCGNVLIQSLRNTTYELNEKRFSEALLQAQQAQLGNRDTTFMEHGHPVTMKTGPYIEPSEAEKAQQRRAIRAQIQDGDSTEPHPEPPPRPSEVQWYDEHCYQGKPR